MPQFLVLAYDATDAGAYERRLKARDAHVATISRYKARGQMHLGAALLDQHGKMTGSVIIAEFPDQQALDAWIAEEPYVTGNVWAKIEVMPCQLGPSFAKT